MKRLTKPLASFLTFALLFSALPLGVFAYEYTELDVKAILEEERELTEYEFDAFIGLMEAYISFEDGEIIVDEAIEELSDILGKEALDQMVEGIEYLNELADENAIVITENGTIFEYDDDEFTLQCCRNRTTRHWWGTRTDTNRARTTQWANTFAQVSNVAQGAALAAGLFGLAKAAFTSAVAGVYFGTLSAAMNRKNTGHSRGIRTSMPWVPLAFSTARQ